jgi:hypothetical protein
MAGVGNFLVGGQFQVTANLPGGKPGLPAAVLGGGAGIPPINGSAWIEGPVLVGSPISYPTPGKPEATLMIGRSKNPTSPTSIAGPIVKITSRGSAPTPLDVIIGDNTGPVGIRAVNQVVNIRVLTKTTYVAPKTDGLGKLKWTGKVDVTGKTSFTGKSTTTGKKVINGKTNINGNLSVAGKISSPTITELKIKIASKKGFDIPHPSKTDHRLRYICIEGPEAEVYFRGKLSESNVIELPDYWKDLVDVETIGVTLTPIGVYQELFVDKIEWGTRVIIKNNLGGPINCNFVVFGERKDTPKNITEYKGLTSNDYPGDNNEYTINGG